MGGVKKRREPRGISWAACWGESAEVGGEWGGLVDVDEGRGGEEGIAGWVGGEGAEGRGGGGRWGVWVAGGWGRGALAVGSLLAREVGAEEEDEEAGEDD